ncbi:MAG TPA: hypothetical protein VL243_04740 [Vicinamibacterales bacterium]|nr:hypothetical protein [Vicinamibacterales bacterium]
MKFPEARRTWLLVVVFAIGMAWVESASVYYLRVMFDRLDPYQANPMPLGGVMEQVELVREAATLLMLFTIGALAGRTWRTRLGYATIAFGVWDIFYYVFLYVICGWPKSLFDWDLLFLLPLPWWGPVLAPVCIAMLMIGWGTLVSQSAADDPATSATSTAWRLTGLGVALALYVFMADTLRVLPQGFNATRTVLPEVFNWWGFLAALALMAAPVAQIGWRMVTRQGGFTDVAEGGLARPGRRA